MCLGLTGAALHWEKRRCSLWTTADYKAEGKKISVWSMKIRWNLLRKAARSSQQAGQSPCAARFFPYSHFCSWLGQTSALGAEVMICCLFDLCQLFLYPEKGWVKPPNLNFLQSSLFYPISLFQSHIFTLFCSVMNVMLGGSASPVSCRLWNVFNYCCVTSQPELGQAAAQGEWKCSVWCALTLALFLWPYTSQLKF